MPCGSEDIKIIDHAHRASTALWGPPGADRVTQPDVLDERGRRTASAAIQAIPTRNEALPQGKIRKTTKSALGRKRNDHVGRQFPRRARPEPVRFASALVVVINKNPLPDGAELRLQDLFDRMVRRPS